MSQHLFTLDIPNTETDTAKGGQFVCTSPAEKVYVLTFTSPPDNRLASPFLRTFLLALDIIEHRYPRGLVITTSGIAKFYSNGLDLDHVGRIGFAQFLTRSFFPVMHRLLSYPMPTMCLINGHAFAGGLLIAMCHDYRLQSGHRGFLCMNEVLFGMAMDTPMLSVLREKIPDARTYRQVCLEGHRFPAKEAEALGLVDGIIGADGGSAAELVKEAVAWATAKERELQKKADAGVYGPMKEDMYRETLGFLTSHEQNVGWRSQVEVRNELRRDAGRKDVEGWEQETSSKGSKL